MYKTLLCQYIDKTVRIQRQVVRLLMFSERVETHLEQIISCLLGEKEEDVIQSKHDADSY